MGKTDSSPAQFFLAYPNASATENTFVRVINEQGTARVYRQLRQDFSKPFCLEFYAEMFGYLLKVTGAIFETMGAIHRMTSQEQFQSGAG